MFVPGRCPPVPLIAHATITPADMVVNHGSNVTVKCNMGYKFPDGTESKVFYCDPETEWDDLYGTVCKGQLIILLLLLLI